jgi:Asp-tRNA(Asn)/Glu-tRNA(Gln) amidotransferase A subunit family amidase
VVGVKPSFGAINRGGSHDYMSQSAQGVLAGSLADAWLVLRAIADRAGGDPGHPGLAGPAAPPQARKPKALVVLETPGWGLVGAELRAAFAALLDKMKASGVTLLTRRDKPEIEKVEGLLHRAMPLTRIINGWESRWPLNTYAERDASKLSAPMRERLAEAEALTQDDYRKALAERAEIRTTYAGLAALADACVTLAAPGPAPVGLASTGDPSFAVPGSLLGAPALSLPLLSQDGLPVGLQVLGYDGADADLFAVAAAIEAL